MQKIVALLLFSFFMSISLSLFPSYSFAQRVQKGTFPLPTAENSPSVAGEVIVTYKDGQSPQDLHQEVVRRSAVASTPIIGGLRIAAENLSLERQGKETPETALNKIEAVEQAVGAIQSRSLDPSAKDTYLVRTTNKDSLDQTIRQFTSLSQVAYAEPNYIRYARSINPNDEIYSLQWDMKKIQADRAWDITQGSNTVTVAVVDTGVAYTHPDLPPTIIKGHDYANNDNDPMDDNDHGTHVAGTISAIGNNSIGIAGLNWHVQLVAIKVLNKDGAGSDAWILPGIREAADKGAKVINLSLGGPGSCTQGWQDAINYARSKGALVVVATAEDHTADPNAVPKSVDQNPDTPTSCSGVLSVAATNANDQRASYSYYGSTISMAAPGGDIDPTCNSFDSCAASMITSTARPLAQGSYLLMIGTSMAAPHVSGVAALLLAQNPALTNDQVKNILISSADTIATDHPIGKRLNAYNAVLAAQSNTSVSSTPTLTSTPVPNSSDINHDGSVNLLDFTIWKCEFIGSGTCTSPVSNKSADVNGDGIVNLLDFSIWRTNYHP